ncbi:MAG: TetR/AcrR family transcriptional regulator [Myxococcota bacterium]|nr:TetR/AcrR family transcriptional regulator [Myxococcota bacterium]
MARPKSDPEVMRQRILDAAEQLIVEHGAKAVTLRQIAKKVGVSHPAVLYYFDGLPALIEALQQRTARALRTTLLSQLSDVGAPGVRTSVAGAMEELAQPQKGAVLAWLIAEGRMPFPAAEERGLRAVVDRLVQATPHERASIESAVELVVLASIGEALVGPAVRARLAREGEVPAWSERLMAIVTSYLASQDEPTSST